MSKIEINNIYKIFGPNPQQVMPMVKDGASKEQVMEETGHTVGLDNVSLSIEEGEIFVCMGLSGSGKSTLIRHINRLIDPTAGEDVDGKVDDLIAARERQSVKQLHHFAANPRYFYRCKPGMHNCMYLIVYLASKEACKNRGEYWRRHFRSAHGNIDDSAACAAYHRCC